MTTEPPKVTGRRWAWLVPLAVIGAALVLLLVWLWPRMLEDGTVNANTWVGFAGNILSAGLGVWIAVHVLRRTLRHENAKRRREERWLRQERVLHEAKDLGDMASDALLGDHLDQAHLREAALRMNRQVNKLGLVMEYTSENRRVFEVLTQASSAFQSAVNYREIEEVESWLRSRLLPQVEQLANLVAADDVGADDIYSTAADLEALVQGWLYEWLGPYPVWALRQSEELRMEEEAEESASSPQERHNDV